MKTLLFLGALCGAVVLAAELGPSRTEVYAGAGGGALLGLAGFVAAARIAARVRDSAARGAGRTDIWGLWAAGLLVRLALLAGLVLLFRRVWGLSPLAAFLSLAGVYLALLFWETLWLSRLLSGQAPEGRRGDG
jgi:hypothetical protein